MCSSCSLISSKVLYTDGFHTFLHAQLELFLPQQTPSTNAPLFNESSSASPSSTPGQQPYYGPESAFALWPAGTPVDISVYLHESIILPPLSHPAIAQSKVFDEKSFTLGDKSDKRLASVDVPFPRSVQNNGTLWAHIFISQSGAIMDPTDENYDSTKAYRMAKPLTKYLPKKKIVKTKKLIGATEEEKAAQELKPEVPVVDAMGNPIITSYWHSNLTLEMVDYFGTMDYRQSPPQVKKYIRLESTGKRDETGQNGWYYPILFINDFWQLKEHMVELNSTVT